MLNEKSQRGFACRGIVLRFEIFREEVEGVSRRFLPRELGLRRSRALVRSDPEHERKRHGSRGARDHSMSPAVGLEALA